MIGKLEKWNDGQNETVNRRAKHNLFTALRKTLPQNVVTVADCLPNSASPVSPSSLSLSLQSGSNKVAAA